MRLIAAGSVAMLVGFVYLEGTSPEPGLGETLTSCLLFGLGITFFVDMLSTRVEARGSVLGLVNPVTETLIPVADVSAVDRADGGGY